jgi:signal transduction histidine kinase
MIASAEKRTHFAPPERLDPAAVAEQYRRVSAYEFVRQLVNALEATPRDGVVSAGCGSAAERVAFRVHNPGVIPVAARWQIFQRSFSTKGVNRGLGTYSVKLLTERYLHGRAGFTTSTDGGTTFFVELPLRP